MKAIVEGAVAAKSGLKYAACSDIFSLHKAI
jgi:hypothetical protein